MGPEVLVDAEDEAGATGEAPPFVEPMHEAEHFAAAAVEAVEVVEQEDEGAAGGGEAAEVS